MSSAVSYDSENDIFSVHNGFASDEKFKGNIDIGDLVLDVSTKGRVIGMEVMNAAMFFKEFIGGYALDDVADAKLNASFGPASITIGIVLKMKDAMKEMPAKIVVPLRNRY